jgi:hypothetical protein
MRWLADFKIATNNLKATRVRTALTILGIVIGVMSVTVVFALGEGAKNMVQSQIQTLGDNMITVRPGKASRDSNNQIKTIIFLAALGVSHQRDLQTRSPPLALPPYMVTGSVLQVTNKAKALLLALQVRNQLDLLYVPGVSADSPRSTVVWATILQSPCSARRC